MSKPEYVMIRTSDGDTRLSYLTEEQLQSELSEAEDCGIKNIFSAFPSGRLKDPAYWEYGDVLIIKGELFSPDE